MKNLRYRIFSVWRRTAGWIKALSILAVWICTYNALELLDTEEVHIRETVMAPGSMMQLNVNGDPITVVAYGDYQRKYAWRGCEYTQNYASKYTRWGGRRGGDAAEAFSWTQFNPWKDCSGKVWVASSESQIHFLHPDGVGAWLERKGRNKQLVEGERGLVVFASHDKHSGRLDVEIFRICPRSQWPSDIQFFGSGRSLNKAVLTGKLKDCSALSNAELMHAQHQRNMLVAHPSAPLSSHLVK